MTKNKPLHVYFGLKSNFVLIFPSRDIPMEIRDLTDFLNIFQGLPSKKIEYLHIRKYLGQNFHTCS